MAAIDFPSSPTLNQTFTVGNTTYTWDGEKWTLTATAGSAGGVSTFSAGTTGLTPSTDTTGAVTLAGTLATGNGGTGLTTFTAANRAVYSTSASALTAGTLPVAAGGTGATTLTANNVIIGNGTSAVGFVAPGTSGNVLTSNGTVWSSTAPTAAAPTTAQVGTATAGLAVGALGSYAWMVPSTDLGSSAATPGNTYSGATLRYAGLYSNQDFYNNASNGQNIYEFTWTSTTPSGTWRIMSTMGLAGFAGSWYGMGHFLRSA